jgi:hypothetical protein
VNLLKSKIVKPVIIIILLFSFKGISQTKQPIANDTMETLVTAGEDASGGSGTVTYSIGQVFYTDMAESTYNVSQGVQQGAANNNLSTEENGTEATTEVSVFPNPTIDYVTIKILGSQVENIQGSYRLYDLQGRLLKQEAAIQSETQLNITDLRAAIYLLQVYNDNEILKTFKIVKK